jgi:ribosomal protein S13
VARIAGVDLAERKRIEIALTYIYRHRPHDRARILARPA